MELVRFTEDECQAWHLANEIVPLPPNEYVIDDGKALCLTNIYLMDGSWTSTEVFSGCCWVWIDDLGLTQLMGIKKFAQARNSLLTEVETLRWVMDGMLQHSQCQIFGTDCKNLIAMLRDPQELPSFATEIEVIQTLHICFPTFKILYVPRAKMEGEDGAVDSLAKSSRLFHRKVCTLVVLSRSGFQGHLKHEQ